VLRYVENRSSGYIADRSARPANLTMSISAPSPWNDFQHFD
jgi:hypothetical protein